MSPLGCLNVPVADAPLMSALISVLLKTLIQFSHLHKHKAGICAQVSLSLLPLVLSHLTV